MRDFTFIVCLLCCGSNGFFYTFSIFSTRLRILLDVTSTNIVLLGILSQAGLGFLQYPTTYLLGEAQKRGVSIEGLDLFQSIFAGVLMCTAMFLMGTISYLAENGSILASSYSLACFAFFIWGQGVGQTFNSCSAIVNFNYQHSDSVRRRSLALLSFCVGIGGVLLVIVYFFVLQNNCALSTFFFILGVWYGGLMVMRIRFMKRKKYKVTTTSALFPDRHSSNENNEGEEEEEEENPPPLDQHIVTSSAQAHPQSLLTLLKSDIVWLTFIGTFLGVALGGTFLSTIGNLGVEVVKDQDITFGLIMCFLVAQTMGRLCNAVAYGYREFAYIFAIWQSVCLLGLCVFLILPTEMGAYASAGLVGLSFGGFHSAFPVIAATAFPGNNKVDYPQSIGITLFCSSVGVICVGQITTVVYKASSLDDFRDEGYEFTFVFFVCASIVATISAVLLGLKITKMKQNRMVLTTTQA